MDQLVWGLLPQEAPADLVGLGRLTLWCQRRYAPLMPADRLNGLWLDITGCIHVLAR